MALSVDPEGVRRGLTLPSVFAAAVECSPAAVALTDADGSSTWSEWAADVDAVARGLQELGIGTGDVVAVQLANCGAFETVHLAVSLVGAVLMPVHAGYGSAEVLALLGRVHPAAVVLPPESQADGGALRGTTLKSTVPSLRAVLIAGAPDGAAGSAGDLVWLDELRSRWAGARPSPVDVQPDQPFVLLPSSGTTSARPKICVHSHDGLLSNTATLAVDAGGDALGTGVVLVAGALTHLFGLQAMYSALLTSSPQALPGAWDVDRCFAMAAEVDPVVVYAVPTQLYDMVGKVRGGGRPEGFAPREVRTAGAVLTEALATEVHDVLGASVVVVWGMSEIGYGTHTHADDPLEVVAGTVGRPARGSRVRVVDADGQPCPAGVTGELEYQGPGMFRGYLNEPELTVAAITADGWLHTGDMAALTEDGVVIFHGRSSELINVGGQKFNATEIQSLLAGLPGLDPVAVVAKADSRLGEYPCLVVTKAAADAADLPAVTGFLRERGVAEYKMPLEVVVVDELPRTPAGKLDRRALEASLHEEPRADDAGWQSSTSYDDALTLVRECAGTILGRDADRITPDGPFRTQGVNSLLAIRLANLLAETTGLPLPASIAFDFPTPTAIAQLLSDRRATASMAESSA
ncbi:AMP-binding protein [Actinophytocola sp.]|uniref:AMP-binding protein n=1 Tax=Actinophytocola sp. TaxID=1872138 RepID=UPI002ED9C2C4